MNRLEDKRALITGGTSGIGMETARRFLAEGAHVAITGINPTTIQTARAELGDDVLVIRADAGDVAGQTAVAEAVHQAFGSLDILFVNAGVIDHRPVEKWDEAGFDRSIAIMLKGPFFLVQALLPILAILQYRWIGQVSDAERERRQRTLQHATNAITQELDVELVRAVIGLQVDGSTLRSDDWTVYTERVAGWHKATAAPGILRDVLLVDRGPIGLRLRHWSDETRRFVDLAWPDDMAGYRARFATELAAWESHPPDELILRARGDWPECCGREMRYARERAETGFIPSGASNPAPVDGPPSLAG